MEGGSTERLELCDSYVRRFEARIIARRLVGDLHALVLSRSAFYPGGGGQPEDRGWIEGIPVVRVCETDGERLHFVADLPSTDAVQCEIDWGRRFEHMQQHHGSHLLARAFATVAHAGTDSFRIGTERCTFDVDAPAERIAELLADVESVANDAVWRNLDIEVRQHADTSQGSHRGNTRIVAVKDFDATPCGGTHPRRTAEVGAIAIVSARRWGARTRVEFVCGGRVLASFARDRALLEEAARTVRCMPAEVPPRVGKLLADASAARAEAARLATALADLEAEQLLERHDNGPVVAAVNCRDLGPSLLHALARAVAVRGRIALLGTVHDGQAHVCFARPRGPGVSMQDACVSAVEVLGGRGGGSREFAHGAGTDAGRLPEALALASAKVSNDPTGVATPGRAAGSPAGLAPCNRPIPVEPR